MNLVISWIIAWQKAIRTQAGLELSDFVKIKNAPTPTDKRENVSDTMTMSYCIKICSLLNTSIFTSTS